MLKAQSITKAYKDKTALDNFSLNIPQGSIYGLLGPNGAGKTTFIRILNQITQPDAGEIYLNNEKLQPKHIKDIGYMPEERGLYKNMPIGDQALYFAQLKGMSEKEAREKLNYWFDKLHIEKWWKKKVSELSKGMAQKIQFVVTVLHDPKLLIFDEPFSGFDPVNANIIRDEILELKKKGTTIIFSTHRMESVEELCDNVALIHESKKILDGPVKDIKHSFKNGDYSVQLKEFNPELFERFRLNSNLENIHIHDNMVNFRIQVNEHQPNELLQDLIQIGKVNEFNEVIPSMNEIFINTVKNNHEQ